jgi:hypothetical protein
MLYEIITPQPLVDLAARAALLRQMGLHDDGSVLLVTKIRGRIIDAWLARGADFIVLQSCGLALVKAERFQTTADRIIAYVARVNAHPGGAAQLVKENAHLQKIGLSLVQYDTQMANPELAGDDAAALLAAADLLNAAPGV